MNRNYDYINELAEISNENNNITESMYIENHVNRGLRDLNGNGVVTGLTEVSEIISKEKKEDETVIPCNGKLYYRGVNIQDIVKGFWSEKRFGFEETVYLLLFSKLPNKRELEKFQITLSEMRILPESFTRDVILKAPGKDMMNMISRSVLSLYAYDNNPDEISIENVLRQSLYLISVFPLLSAYGYKSYRHYHKGDSLIIHNSDAKLSTSENLLRLLRNDSQFTELEARILDLALVLHAEHGGGNNSTFTTHVVTSSGTDTYSAISAALGSLKGPRHGGANVKVARMFDDMKNNVDIKYKGQVKDYLYRLVNKEAFDKAGLIYGMGHAVYSISDPRAEILKKCAKELSVEKGLEEEFELYEFVSEAASEIISEKRRIYKGVSANVDFYSGMIYKMLEIPYEMFTPLFAVARIAGWSAHRIEEIQNAGKIIRPAYIGIKKQQEYILMSER